jgi:hypothetical protein
MDASERKLAPQPASPRGRFGRFKTQRCLPSLDGKSRFFVSASGNPTQADGQGNLE